MTNRTVLTADLRCDECKRTAFKSITEIEGVDSITINLNEKTITVDGDADPVRIAKNLGKKFKGTRIVSYGPLPPPRKPAEKKEAPKEDAPRKEEPKPVVMIVEPFGIRDSGGHKKQFCTIL